YNNSATQNNKAAWMGQGASETSPAAAVARLLNAFWTQDADGAARAVTDDFQFINVPFAHRPLVGRAALREVVARGNLGFPEPLEDHQCVVTQIFERDLLVMG